MDAIQSKLNVIEWLTDFKGQFHDRERDKLVEIKHKKGCVAFIYTANNLESLLSKLDTFLDRKLKVTHRSRGKVC